MSLAHVETVHRRVHLWSRFRRVPLPYTRHPPLERSLTFSRPHEIMCVRAIVQEVVDELRIDCVIVVARVDCEKQPSTGISHSRCKVSQTGAVQRIYSFFSQEVNSLIVEKAVAR